MHGITLLRLVSSCAFATASTIFYKKTFQVNGVGIVGSVLLFGCVLELFERLPIPVYSCLILLNIGLLCYSAYTLREWLATATKSDDFFTFVPFFLAILDVRCGLGEMLGFNSLAWTSLRIIASAVPQFLRKPLWLKTKLQHIRPKLGPIYVLSVTHYVLTRTTDSMQWAGLLANMTMVAAVVAGVFFRPDNSAMLNLVGDDIEHVFSRISRMKLPERRYYHGRLMGFSIVGCVVLAAVDYFCTI